MNFSKSKKFLFLTVLNFFINAYGGITNFTLLENKEKAHKVLFLGDCHEIPEEKIENLFLSQIEQIKLKSAQENSTKCYFEVRKESFKFLKTTGNLPKNVSFGSFLPIAKYAIKNNDNFIKIRALDPRSEIAPHIFRHMADTAKICLTLQQTRTQFKKREWQEIYTLSTSDHAKDAKKITVDLYLKTIELYDQKAQSWKNKLAQGSIEFKIFEELYQKFIAAKAFAYEKLSNKLQTPILTAISDLLNNCSSFEEIETILFEIHQNFLLNIENAFADMHSIYLISKNREQSISTIFIVGSKHVTNLTKILQALDYEISCSQELEVIPSLGNFSCIEKPDFQINLTKAIYSFFGLPESEIELVRYCGSCKKRESSPSQLLRCARCKEAFYCNKECQIAHWKAGHKSVCKPKTT